MCGIIGILSNKEVSSTIIDVLKKLEYRGYDSAGIATISNNEIRRQRAKGKIENLVNLISQNDLPGRIGIGHTRWATHGIPSEDNAHPHHVGSVVGVHNGIIENFREIKEELINKGYKFNSDTDTEVIIQLCSYYTNKGYNNKDAFFKTIGRLEGAFALCFMFKDDEEKLYVTRRSAPLVIGYGKKDVFVGSDAVSLSNLIESVIFLDEDDVAIVSKKQTNIYDKFGERVNRKKKSVDLNSDIISKGNYQHFMLKEIHEQPEVFGYATSSFINFKTHKIEMLNEIKELDNVDRLIFVACGTAYYACAVAKFWFEKYVKVPVEIDVASEFRYRDTPFSKNEYAIFVSQSGETADTLAALRKVKGKVNKTISIVNVVESSIARESEFVLPIKAGPEIGVASTKAFTAQLAVLACLAINFSNKRGLISRKENSELIDELVSVPGIMSNIIKKTPIYKEFAKKLMKAKNALFLGRGILYPLALEAALKLKEISYIHAEGYPSGELKHGPIALVDKKMPVICFAPVNNLFEKTISNVQEVQARNGKVLLITDDEGASCLNSSEISMIKLPKFSNFISPIIYAIPSQLIAYYTALYKGTDIDKPRNLAKSVTVE